MRNFILTLFFLMVLMMTFSSLGIKEQPQQKADDGKINLFSETFGDKNNPAIILNMGAGGQAIHWPEEFCKKLAERGYFVIRYDYRDTGLSQDFDFDKEPYDILRLVFDTHQILDQHGIVKAHYLGFSMGGQLAQIGAGFHPRRMKSIVLIGTSTDFRPGFDAFEGKYSDKGLTPPHKDYVNFINSLSSKKDLTEEEKISDYVQKWKMLDGNPADFDEEFFRKQAVETFSRSKLQNPYINHSKAMKLSYDFHEKAVGLIKLPTLIIQGKNDPVFPMDHGADLNKKIAGSKLVVWDNFAHAISPRNFDRLIVETDNFLKNIE